MYSRIGSNSSSGIEEKDAGLPDGWGLGSWSIAVNVVKAVDRIIDQSIVVFTCPVEIRIDTHLGARTPDFTNLQTWSLLKSVHIIEASQDVQRVYKDVEVSVISSTSQW
jgi:hypothetical protein